MSAARSTAGAPRHHSATQSHDAMTRPAQAAPALRSDVAKRESRVCPQCTLAPHAGLSAAAIHADLTAPVEARAGPQSRVMSALVPLPGMSRKDRETPDSSDRHLGGPFAHNRRAFCVARCGHEGVRNMKAGAGLSNHRRAGSAADTAVRRPRRWRAVVLTLFTASTVLALATPAFAHVTNAGPFTLN